MSEPTREYIERLINDKESIDRGRLVQDYYAQLDISTAVPNDREYDTYLDTQLSYKVRLPRDITRSIPKHLIMPQVALYQIPILGLYGNEPISLLHTDDECIYIPIGNTRIYAKYTHGMVYMELCNYRPKQKSIVSVLIDTNNRIKQTQGK